MSTRFAALIVPLAFCALAGCAQSPASPPLYAYRCQSGRGLDVSYAPDGVATLHYAGRTLRLTRAIAASGERYVGADVEWWTKGSGPGSPGTLFRRQGNVAGAIVESCAQQGRL